MLRTTARLAMMTAFVAAPLVAQGGGGSMGGMRMGDPTKQVAGTGKLPAGWMVRFDPGAPHTAADVNFVTMGSGTT